MAVQRVRRVIRKIDPWTVLKVTLVFNAIMALVFVLGTVIFWSIFVNAGIPEKINDLALLIGIENGINLEGAVFFRIVLLLSVIGTILMTGFFTLGAVVYNLISDLVGREPRPARGPAGGFCPRCGRLSRPRRMPRLRAPPRRRWSPPRFQRWSGPGRSRDPLPVARCPLPGTPHPFASCRLTA
jgi:hypothetical protein